jgi:hypothetical protein
LPGFIGLAAHDLRMLCFQALNPTPSCVADGTYMQIIAARNLEYDDVSSPTSFTADVVIMEVELVPE